MYVSQGTGPDALNDKETSVYQTTEQLSYIDPHTPTLSSALKPINPISLSIRRFRITCRQLKHDHVKIITCETNKFMGGLARSYCVIEHSVNRLCQYSHI